ncbi:MAG: hypothetical protein LPK02_08945 [Rhodobacterales bacterium]|nr:hypothetical protein [Rhodobacterales bacterium]MDX5413158.1 hypothetical protein [Rhodobacterales bacterium]
MLIRDRFSARDSRRVRGRLARSWRPALLPLALLLAACAAPPLAPPSPSGQPLPEISARFDSPPTRLLDALPRLCTEPAQRITRPAPGVTECRMLLGPEATAGAILRYGGTINRLPESVVRMSVREDAEGFVVSSAAYLEVPRAAGDVLRVVFPDPEMDRRMARVLANLGGTLP